ncbi:MAG TPA: MerR family transcriptional regulator [Desulfitobacteriaceae bacterium]|nr:MerR family transcriptional regulator [Desulfitobacteriaceae bacterium]
MNPLILIGEMARIHGISAQTLRYYDKIDLFKPSYIEESGYRYYGIEQFAHLESILFLKGTGMPLKEIKRYFKNRGLDSMLALLEKRVDFINEEIVRLKNKKKKIELMLKTVNNYFDKNILGKCRFQQMPERQMLFFTFGNGDIFVEHELGIKKLGMEIKSIDELYLNPFGSVIAKNNIINGDYANYKGITMVFEHSIPDNLTTIPLPEGIYATMVFVGTYKDTKNYFREITKQIKENCYEITGDGLVLIITDKAYSDYEYEYISEIQIPVKL